ncbi:MAG: cupin domain-containing protein [Novosphingobium sp.]|nr:cupin domain-containing protein [Novosphingobium sp.]
MVCTNPAGGRVRMVDFALMPDDVFCSQILYQSEGILVILSCDPPLARGPGAHTHIQDQFFYCLGGELELELGAEMYRLVRGSLAHIPAGTKHLHWNEGNVPEFHLEILVPGVAFYAPGTTFIDEDGEWEPGGNVIPPAVKIAAPAVRVLSDPTGTMCPALPDSHNVLIAAVSQSPGSSAANDGGMRVHACDQVLYVTGGRLAVDIALDSYEVAEHGLVIIPAGVPFRHRAVGDGVQTHLLLVIPADGAGAGAYPAHNMLEGEAVDFAAAP